MQNPSAPEILLASSSPYRRGLLDRFLVEFEAVSPDIDESNTEGLEPAELARHLARAKAEAVSASSRNALIIGADQLAALDGHVLGKPGSDSGIFQIANLCTRILAGLNFQCKRPLNSL